MAAQSYAFVTVAQMKVALDIDSGETTWDTILEDLIDECTLWIEKYCGGRRFRQSGSDQTELYDGKDGGKIFLKNFPIISITSVSYRSGGDYSNPTWDAFSAQTDYIRDDAKGILHFGSLLTGVQNIRVIYKGGYANDGSGNPTVPDDLVRAVKKLVGKEFNRRKSEGVLSESLAGSSVSWEPLVDGSLQEIIDQYRIFL